MPMSLQFAFLKEPLFITEHLQSYLETFANWCRQWGVNMNGTMSKAIPILKVPSRYPDVEFATTKVKAAIHALYPLLCAKCTMSLRNQLFFFVIGVAPPPLLLFLSLHYVR
ncbi:hypothetical protein Zmor_011772 [Zophobas morio]|jgi:hypothetical protein|uniref:Uncharacterized protein n=1 Tax=Zophobas morio TaxID=2755281 RepID=A0AA38HJ71_9CUCU|nr:hypothetical protein Zmor_011772 [Zophobas morio]